MNKRLIYYISATIIIIIISSIITAYGSKRISHNINLPAPDEQNGENTGIFHVDRIDITPETVQTILQTLKKVDSYSRSYIVKDYWENGEKESTLNVWKKSNNTKISIYQNKIVKNILVVDNNLYIWYEGTAGMFTSKLPDGKVESEVVKFSRLVNYEDILNVPRENILNASYAEYSKQPCVYVEYKSGNLGYVNQVFVSIDNGLLLSLNRYDGDTLIYSMMSVSTNLSTPSDDIFKVPSTGTA